ncbi:protein kinase domain-containing protein [Candidatus Uabimicrobium amorphum]|uniref:Serine/threonine protein kinase n=1 Tax=Uabimicrobium amorphum TaxID=2596890 RepID=A0A5S9IQB3_UABAM|nr:protein kinase [Candidatus Uabimicrobium amorphum]BBM85676.1 serine/threonine protein kinase [Candidatus Uabimicrobium amorphum]
MKNKTFVVNQRKHRVKEKIGEGSHAVVWLAEAIFYPHDAITIKTAKDDSVAKERIKNEIEVLKELHHPNVPQMLARDKEWFAMPHLRSVHVSLPDKGRIAEYDISNLNLETGYPHHAKNIPLKYRENLAIRVIEDVANVIEYIASTGVIHADISPGNIMESRGSLINKKYLLTDWGATVLVNEVAEESFGSLHFVAPERFVDSAETKSDLYSLGAVAFYILTGTIPYPGNSGEEYYLNTAIYDGVSPADIEKDILPSLARLIAKLVRKEPKDRPLPEEVLRKIQKIKQKFV